MPIVNFTIPDSSPWISYVGKWGDSDAATQFYTNGTFHFTQEPGAYATFAFNGTAVYLYGAHRQNHDAYTVSVDGKNATGNGHTDDPAGVFNVSLYGDNSLSAGTHTVELVNTPSGTGKYVDLDWAVITVGDGNTKTLSNDFWLDDSSGNFTYDAGWATAKNSLSSQYHNSTFTASNKDNAKATLTFYGNAIALYGATSSNHGNYSVSLDGAAARTYNGNQVAFRPQNLLYYASSLPSGAHTLTVANLGATYTDLDYAVVSVWDATVPLSSAVSAGPSSSVAGSATSSATAVTGSPSTPATFTLPHASTSTRPSSTAPSSSSPGAINPTTTTSAALSSKFGVSKGAALAVVSTVAITLISFVAVA